MNIHDFIAYRWEWLAEAAQRTRNHGIGRCLSLIHGIRQPHRDYRDLPVVITSFNRLACLERLVRWLERAEMRRLWILDNASTYPPLLVYLKKSPHSVIRLKRNLGPYALWRSKLVRQFWNDYYLVTDPDVVPTDACPLDLAGHLLGVLQRYQKVRRVGVGLRIDDLPAHFAFKDQVCHWESRFWKREAEPGLYWAAVDTTLAIYRPRTMAGDGLSLRTGGRYQAMHLPWYADSSSPSEEDRFYQASVIPGGSWWTQGAANSVRDSLLISEAQLG